MAQTIKKYSALQNPPLRNTIQKELFSISSLLIILVFAFFYIALSALLLNYKLVSDTITGGFSLSSQLTIYLALLQGVWTTMHIWDSFLLIINGLFVGMNLLLIGKTIFLLEHMGKVRLSIGGVALLTLVTTGCASCGLSFLSIVGFSTALYALPFHGLELRVAATIILMISGIYLLYQLHKAKYCKV